MESESSSVNVIRQKIDSVLQGTGWVLGNDNPRGSLTLVSTAEARGGFHIKA
jgi:hypothetical protein